MQASVSPDAETDRSLAAVIGRAFDIPDGPLPIEVAERLQDIDLAMPDRLRFEELSEIAREAGVPDSSRDEFDALTTASRRFALWRVRARLALGLPPVPTPPHSPVVES